MQVFLMTAISYIRYDILKNHKNEKSISSKIIINSVVISMALSLFWSVMPIFNWSYYSLEDGLVSCSVEYNEKSLNVISYNIGIFLFHYICEVGDPVLHGDRVSPKLILVPILEEKWQRFRAALVTLVSCSRILWFSVKGWRV